MQNENLLKVINAMVCETTIGKRGEDGTKTFQLNLANMSINGIVAILRYGAQRIVNDRCGGSDKTLKDKEAIASMICGQLMDGSIGERKERAAGVDLLTQFARKVAIRLIKAKDKAKLKGLEGEKLAEIVDAFILKNEKVILPMAQAELDAANAEREAMAGLAAELEF